MSKLPSLLVILVTASVDIVHTQDVLRRVCYYTNWAQYRSSVGQFFPENVDPFLCTHINYAFAKLAGNTLAAFEWNDESTPWSEGMYERFNALKLKNTALKTLLAVGGWNLGSQPFTQIVHDQQSRAEFIQSAISFVRRHNFDGLDVDWEYPANRGSPPADRDRFTDLIRELRAAFTQEAASTGMPPLLLTAAVGAGKSKIDTAYDVPELNKYLDFFNLMTYDLHGSWEPYTGHHTALFPRAAETGDDLYLNVDFAANYWVQKGASPDKLVIGLATYGHSFTLSNSSHNGVGAPAPRPGDAGQITREAGVLAYYEICQIIQNGGQVQVDPEQYVPYVTRGNQWIGYDDENSLTQKVCYVKQHGFGGVMVWTLDDDDFTGTVCGRGSYPLMHAINNEINNPSFENCPNPAGIPPAQRTTMMPQPLISSSPVLINGVSSTTPNAQSFSCVNLSNGPYPSSQACDEYFICANQVSFSMRCAVGLYYNPVSQNCDWPNQVNCVSAGTSTIRVPQPPIITTPPPSLTIQTQPPSRSTATTTTSTRSTTAAAPDDYNVCVTLPNGLYRVPDDCNKYIECFEHISIYSNCPVGKVFNEAMGSCQQPYNTPECASFHDADIVG